MKYALYCRVSTEEQTTDNQEVRLLEYVKSKGYEYNLFKETMSTRKTRPVKQVLLQKLRSKEYDGVIIWKLDRWARSSTELVLEIQELHDKGLIFISLSDNIDLSSAGGKLQFQILSAFAEFERALISERTKEGLRRTKMKGTQLGRPKGKKDSKKRRKAGYLIRHAKERKERDEKKGIYKPVEDYIDKEE